MSGSGIANDLLRLERVRIENFRCFKTCDVKLHPCLTVIVADNGKGKTAVLEAIRYSLESYVFAVAPSIESDFVDASEIHRCMNDDGVAEPCIPTRIEATAIVGGVEVNWLRDRRSAKVRRKPNHQIKELRVAAVAAAERAVNDVGTTDSEKIALVYPVLAFYRASRAAVIPSGGEVGTPLSNRPDRLSGYVDCFDPVGSFGRFVKWYRAASESLQRHSPESISRKTTKLLASVNDAVRDVLAPTQWNNLQWDYQKDELCVAHQDGRRLPASMMSDGVRNTLAIVADIAHRCCRLNPQFDDKARLQTPGIVLIDEIDLHLHPGWQQQIIQVLKDAFPLVQFVLTTHSPQVLSTVKSDSIRIIRIEDGIGNMDTPVLQTQGVESADVLARVMNVDPIPKVEPAQQLSSYRAMLQLGNDQSDEAKHLFETLVAHFGEEHPLLADVETFRRLQEFKRDNNIPYE